MTMTEEKRPARINSQRTAPNKVLIVCGTRPEVIKLAPVYRALESLSPDIEVLLLATGQHTDMADHTFAAFDLEPDYAIENGGEALSLTAFQSRILKSLGHLYDEIRPDLVVVQGDTASAFVAALAAFSVQIPVAHVEAGLRSFDLQNPYPEEGFRAMIAQVTALHFPPTKRSAENLLNSGIPATKVFVTGNTVTDAALDLAKRKEGWPAGVPELEPGQSLVLITAHRRESWGHDLMEICTAIRTLHDQFKDLSFLFPVHLNPRVREPVMDALSGLERLFLVDPLPYEKFIPVLRRAKIVLTDSGGIQEEAPTFGVPCIVMRRVTERPEAVEAGLAELAGTSHESIVSAVSKLLSDQAHYEHMSQTANPFGDGMASNRIAEAIGRYLQGQEPILTPDEQFASPAPLSPAVTR